MSMENRLGCHIYGNYIFAYHFTDSILFKYLIHLIYLESRVNVPPPFQREVQHLQVVGIVV